MYLTVSPLIIFLYDHFTITSQLLAKRDLDGIGQDVRVAEGELAHRAVALGELHGEDARIRVCYDPFVDHGFMPPLVSLQNNPPPDCPLYVPFDDTYVAPIKHSRHHASLIFVEMQTLYAVIKRFIYTSTPCYYNIKNPNVKAGNVDNTLQ